MLNGDIPMSIVKGSSRWASGHTEEIRSCPKLKKLRPFSLLFLSLFLSFGRQCNDPEVNSRGGKSGPAPNPSPARPALSLDGSPRQAGGSYRDDTPPSRGPPRHTPVTLEPRQ